MKYFKYLSIALILACFLGCSGGLIKNKDTKGKQSEPVLISKTTQVAKATYHLIIKNEQDLIGYWVGEFKPDTNIAPVTVGERLAWNYTNKINVSIDKITGDSVIGHSVIAGNYRPFAGNIKKDGLIFWVNVKEPGDDKYDGKFRFGISQADSLLAGTWTANQKIRISARHFVLIKTVFNYNPKWQVSGSRYVDWSKKKRVRYKVDEGGMGYDDSYFATTNDVYKYNASADSLTKQQVANLKKADLFILRNAIYARHGYSFKNQQLRAFFDPQPWYIPISIDVKNDFTAIEKHNIELLLRYEKNAKEYYDVFGRG